MEPLTIGYAGAGLLFVFLAFGIPVGVAMGIIGIGGISNHKDVIDVLECNTKMVFINAGMGGGTGTGAAPVIAKAAKDLDILTVAIVTIPFIFEGELRMSQAKEGIEELKEHVDSLIVINNNKLREIYGNLGFKSGFAKADEVLLIAARGIAEVITRHFTQNIDLLGRRISGNFL